MKKLLLLISFMLILALPVFAEEASVTPATDTDTPAITVSSIAPPVIADEEELANNILFAPNDTELSSPETASEAATTAEKAKPAKLNDTLLIMGQGMFGILLVMIILILVTVILNKITKNKE
ncbi:MAG: hypothetical protein LBS74_02140 [Oscillospiraceae bacterium]|jgi:hypothetical protein|nr:hypothetical protein [Oscillospiraceae bacterium]